MIRLAVNCTLPLNWPAIAARLRWASLEINPPLESLVNYDAVVFVGPVQQQTVELCLTAGKDVLVAAELCWPQETTQGLFATASRFGVRFAVINPDRYLPSRILLFQQRAAKLGPIGLLRLHRWDPKPKVSQLSCLGLPGPMIRDLDLILWLGGEQANRVYAVERQGDGQDSGHFLHIHLGFPDGGMALVDYSDRLPSGEGYCTLSLIGFSGAAYADDQQNMQLVYKGGSPLSVKTEEGPRAWVNLFQDFADSLRENRNPDDNSWLKLFSLVSAVNQSLATHQAIALGET